VPSMSGPPALKNVMRNHKRYHAAGSPRDVVEDFDLPGCAALVGRWLPAF
jgi:hypothetical protein